MIEPIAFTEGLWETRSFDETLPVLTEIPAVEVIDRRCQEAIVQHPNTDWRPVMHEAGAEAAEKPLLNHYGVRVASRGEGDRAWQCVNEIKDRYRLSKITKAVYNHLA